MSDGLFHFAVLVSSIVFVVITTTRFKLHPFLSLLVAAYGMGLGSGLSPVQTVGAITGGFGKTIGYIGIVIACGCIIGTALERSGCAMVMATKILQLIGRTRSVLAMSITGAVVSIPVFCDSGFVILSPLARSLARQTGKSLAGFAVALSMGLYATHVLVPPTPGPIAAAGELRADLGTVILLGLLVAVPVVATTYAYAQWVGRRIMIDPNKGGDATEAVGAVTARPESSALAAFTPILFAVLLIAMRSVVELPTRPLGDGDLRGTLGLLGDSNTALMLGVFMAWFMVRRHGLETFGTWCGTGLHDSGTIILITAAGGAFGGVLRETPLAGLVGTGFASLQLGSASILLPFIVAAGLKTAIGSSTVAIITTASLVAPLLPSMGLSAGYGPALSTLAIGAGSMMVSHVNDSDFWVITQMSGMTVPQGYRLITVASAVAGLTGIAAVGLLGFVLP